jgi:hypothetical protein
MEKKMSNKIKVIGTLAILFSVISMVLGLFFFFSNRTFVKNAIRTEGRIMDVKQVRTRDGKTSYKSIFVFTDKNNKQHWIDPSIRISSPAYEAGDTVSVLYNPKKPIEAKIESFIYLWGASAACGASGVCFLAVGLVLLLVVPKFVKK